MMRKMLSILLALVMLTACLPVLAEGAADLVAKGDEFLAAGDLAKALASYQLAQKVQPEEEAAYLGEANVLILQEDYSGAAAIIGAVLERNPISPKAWGLKCRIDALQGEVSTFEADVVFAEVCGADLKDAYMAAATMYLAANMPEKAADVLAKAMAGSTDAAQEAQEAQQETPTPTLTPMPMPTPMSAVGAETETAGASAQSALDSAFEAGRLVLEKTEFPIITADAVEIADVVWDVLGVEKPADPTMLISAYLSELTITWLSLSPAGNSGILTAEGMPGISYYNGKYHMFYPSQTRGVEDTYSNLARMYSAKLQMLLGEEGVIYSPDGRYAAIFNCDRTILTAQYYQDPVVIDLSTGEMILTATYADKLNEEGVGAVTTGAFSADGRYLYYMIYGKGTEFLTALYRYDLQTDQTERCYSGSNFHYYPHLTEMKDGSFLILQDVRSPQEMQGVTRIAFENGAWTGTDRTFDLPMQYWKCSELLYSAHSGYALVPGQVGTYYAFQCIRPEEDFAGLNRYYSISKADGQILAMTADEIRTQLDTWANQIQAIVKTALSPDGRYALMLTVNSGTTETPNYSRHLYLVRLDDLAVKEVAGIDPGSILTGDIGARFRPEIEWNTDTLLIGTSDGVQAYRFQP